MLYVIMLSHNESNFCLLIFFCLFPEISVDYYGDQDCVLVTGTIFAPFFVYALASFMEEAGKAVTTAEVCSTRKNPGPLDTLIPMTRKIAKRKRGPISAGVVQEYDRAKRLRRSPRVGDYSMDDCNSHGAICSFPENVNLCKQAADELVNPSRELRDMLSDHEDQIDDAMFTLHHGRSERATTPSTDATVLLNVEDDIAAEECRRVELAGLTEENADRHIQARDAKPSTRVLRGGGRADLDAARSSLM